MRWWPTANSLAWGSLKARGEFQGSGRISAWWTWLRRRITFPSVMPRVIAEPSAVIGAALIGLFLPIPLGYSGLDNASQATQFIGELWQVTAASVALTIAVVLFAFQIVAAIRSSSLREIASATPLRIVVYIGISSILVQGLSLLGVGYDGITGWAGAWATDTAAIAIISVAYLFAISLREVDARALHRRRLQRLQKAVEATIGSDAELRIGLAILRRHAEEHGYQVSEFVPRDPSKLSFTSGASGVVVDIRLDMLARLARIVGDTSLKVGIRIGSQVRSESIIVQIDSTNNENVSTIVNNAIAVSRREPEQQPTPLEDALQTLHEEALQAVRNSRPVAFDDIKEAYEDVLLGFPRAWAKLGAQYTEVLASEFEFFSIGPVETICSNLYEETVVAAAEGQREILFSVCFTPIHIASEAVDLNATGLSRKMLDLFVSMVQIEPAVKNGMSGDILFGNMMLNLFGHINYGLASRLSVEPIDGDIDQRYVNFLEQALNCAISIAKYLVDARLPQRFSDIHRSWRLAMERWEGLDVRRRVRGDGPDDPSVTLGLRILDTTRILHLSLTCWIVRALKSNQGDDVLRDMFSIAAGHYHTFDEVLRTAGNITSLRGEPSVLSRWISASKPSGEAYVIDAPSYIVDGVAALYAFMQSTGYLYEEFDWLEYEGSNLVDEVSRISENPELLQSLGVAALPNSAVDDLRAFVDGCLALQRETKQNNLVGANIDDGLVDGFVAQIRNGLSINRLAVELMKYFGAYHVSRDSTEGVEFRLAHNLQPKQWFVPEQRVFGIDTIGFQIGVGAAQSENAAMWEALGRAKVDLVAADDTEVQGHVHSALSSLRSRGMDPHLIIIGDLQRADTIATEKWIDNRYNEVIRRNLVGAFSSVPILQVSTVPTDRVYVVDMSRWAHWTAIISASAETDDVHVGVEQLTEEVARDIVRRNNDLFSDIDDESGRIFKLLQFVRVDVLDRFNLVVENEEAAVAIQIM